MISNAAYGELKKLKEGNKSFTDVIIDLVSNKKQKTGYDLKRHFGVLKDDEEYKMLEKNIKAGWSR